MFILTILCRPERGLTIEDNAIYVLNTKSQGSTTWSDLTGKNRVSPISWCSHLRFGGYSSRIYSLSGQKHKFRAQGFCPNTTGIPMGPSIDMSKWDSKLEYVPAFVLQPKFHYSLTTYSILSLDFVLCTIVIRFRSQFWKFDPSTITKLSKIRFCSRFPKSNP